MHAKAIAAMSRGITSAGLDRERVVAQHLVVAGTPERLAVSQEGESVAQRGAHCGGPVTLTETVPKVPGIQTYGTTSNCHQGLGFSSAPAWRSPFCWSNASSPSYFGKRNWICTRNCQVDDSPGRTTL